MKKQPVSRVVSNQTPIFATPEFVNKRTPPAIQYL